MQNETSTLISSILSIGLTTISFVLMLGLLVLAHELGHFIAAKQTGMIAEEFAIGMGPVAMKLGVWKGTLFTIRWLPIGGFVKIIGMGPDEDVEGGFNTKSIGARAWVVFAGPLFSLLFGYFIFVGLGMTVGIIKPVPKVHAVIKGLEAERVGIKEGDVITQIDNTKVGTWEAMTKIIKSSGGKKLNIHIERSGQPMVIQATPKEENPEQTGNAKLGFVPSAERVHYSFIGALSEGSYLTYRMAAEIIDMFIHPSKLKDNVGGPIRIVQTTDMARKDRGIEGLALLTAGLSLSLGYINLLPIPILDGGHLMLLLVELLRRGKKLSAKAQLVVQYVGLAIIIALFVSVMALDINHLSSNDEPSAKPAVEQPKK